MPPDSRIPPVPLPLRSSLTGCRAPRPHAHAAPPQMGRLHFGVILGWSVVHSVIMYFIVTQLAGIDITESKGLDLYSICCLLGYCMLPLCMHSAAALFIPRYAPDRSRAQ